MSAFLAAFRETWAKIFRYRAAFSILILAVVAYGFYYPMAYRHQTATQLPLAVVDLDHSGLSRSLTRDIAATEGVFLAHVGGDFGEAERLLQARRVDAILLIPAHLERSVLTGAPPAGLGIYVNGAYIVRASTIGATLTEVMTDSLEEAVKGPAKALGLQAVIPIQVVERPMFNTRQGYGSYVVPGVAMLIVHQTLLLGVVMLAAGRRYDARGALKAADFLGVLAAFALLGLASTLFYVGFVFWFQDYPRGGDFAGMLAAAALYVPTVVLMAMFLGSFFDRPERSAQVLASTSVLLFFLSGMSWPLASMPWPLQALAWCLPSTPGIQAMVKLNQMGASPGEVAPELTILAIQLCVYGALAGWRWLGGGAILDADRRPT